ncbi:chaperone modulator CbpM [Larkinella sp. VNQ87]|uniref:chaperone modulator CbpM n=1 Tax=Larkinella sp. VNQ87 TaxID=3400921 RepID=UPI003BFBCEED
MLPEDVIRVEEYCLKYTVEETFVASLAEYGLLELVIIEEQPFIPLHQLPTLEKFSNLHYELNINLDGIDAIHHLLQRVEAMQDEIRRLKSQLSVYERRG